MELNHETTRPVSTVLLYGIPIVSLYIEDQERLCLAQISNTLLKQYSYNEIHNRRVALGITCVQCTPVQLEILRRAGAMPVSSRRCGMITRREAERLCKSFLGDNAPPRLPEDFAFTVYHKCAWGCRGSFLPSRYNSSRAKCIKCSYCGMFFSPNKFIFHSHRTSPADKYIQPDAANFNSWRRHMILSGQAPEEIVHAWEDVKAMFNGGTRKRLMSHGSSTIQTSAAAQRQQQQDQLQHNTAVSNESGNSTTVVAGARTSTSHQNYPTPRGSSSNLKFSNSSPPPMKRQCDQHEHNVGAVAAAAAAVVGVTAVATAVGAVRPLNIDAANHCVSYNGRTGSVSTLQLSDTNEHELSVMPISRNFMMDYMWHAHAAQNTAAAATHKNRSNNSNTAASFRLPDCAMHWLKTPSINNNATFFTQLPLAGTIGTGGGRNNDNNDFCHQMQYDSFKKNTSSISNNGTLLNNSQELRGLSKFVGAKVASLPQFLTASAFKPVLQQSQQNAFTAMAAVAAASATATLTTSSVYPSTVTVSANTSPETTQAKITSCGLATLEMALPTIAFPTPGTISTMNSAEVAAGDVAAETASNAAKSNALPVHANLCATVSNGLLFGRQSEGPQLPSSLSTLPSSPDASYRAILPAPVSSELALKSCNNDGVFIKGSYSTDNKENNDSCDVEDDEMVDIETTEDDTPASKNLKVALCLTPCHHQPDDTTNPTDFYINNEKRFTETVTNTFPDEVDAGAATTIFINRSGMPLPKESYRNDRQLKSPLQYSQNKSVLTNIDVEFTGGDTVVQKVRSYTQYKHDNNYPPETCVRLQQSPTYSSTSNDSLYMEGKYESNNNSSYIEHMGASCITQIVQQHNTFSLGSSLMWKKLLESEVRVA
ncbi:uncharacterized protein LOC129250712 [Anastrepha obliqua]|uniref:uncharacterized protein LOC129250712 n=1 Tax=Anastrepha obliqua TaxID=95512 RepID=UPI00240A64CB|nr:uncharacterized protein LOC129250712 [Anastrepha obliqua]